MTDKFCVADEEFLYFWIQFSFKKYILQSGL